MFRICNHVVRTLVLLVCLNASTCFAFDELRIKDLPVPEGASDVSFLKRRGDVRFQVETDFKTTGEYYVKTLRDLGWTRSPKVNSQRNFLVQSFSKGQATLEVRVDSRGTGSEVRLTPTGMMWEEDDQPTPEDLPIPGDATEVEYDDFFESIEFKTPADLKTVVGYLTTELEQRKWTKTDTEFDLETFVRMKFTLQKSSLSIDVRAEDAGCEVAIRTEGMQWDGMKAKIEKAEEEAERAAENMPKSQPAEDKPLAIRSRKEKPAQGIDSLPALASQGTIVMDGTAVELPHVMAWEVFEHDEWLTKVIATQKPVRQDSLLARMRRSGTDTDEDGNPPGWPQPHLLFVVDEDDQLRRMQLQAAGVPGSASGDELDGSAIVENGRVRGTARLKEPGSFFDNEYTAEISFDVTILTRESSPAKRLKDVPKLANSGTLTIGNETYKLSSATAYPMKRSDEPMTTIVLSEKPLNAAKLAASLGKEAADSYFEFIPQVQLVVDPEDNVSSVSIWADSVSISGNDDLEGEVVIEDGRARGTARLAKPGEFFDRKYQFELSFDVDVMGGPASPAEIPAGGLVADAYDGYPFPEGRENTSSEGGRFRRLISTSVPATLSQVVEFYRRELSSMTWGEWKEKTAEAKIEQDSAHLTFQGPAGVLQVQLKADGQAVGISLISRDAEAAKDAGLLPSPGKARLVVGNVSETDATITINNREYKVAAGRGAEDPKTGLNWEVPAGKFTVVIKPPGQDVQSEKLTLGADETWGVMIDPSGGFLVIQLY